MNTGLRKKQDLLKNSPPCKMANLQKHPFYKRAVKVQSV